MTPQNPSPDSPIPTPNLATALDLPAPVAAQRLLGAVLTRTLTGPDDPTAPPQILCARIVETEAYDESDPASHSCRGRTPRTAVMFGPAGYLYVYFTYGMHYCCNIVVGPPGHGAAVLIRAVEPLEGAEIMASNRGLAVSPKTLPALTNGPAKLCQSLLINRSLYGHDLVHPPLTLSLEPPLPADQITTTTRIGIKQAVDTPWRFYIKDNPYISRLAT